MRTYLSVNVLLTLIGATLVVYWVFSTERETLTQKITAYQSQIKSSDRPVKTFVDAPRGYACWLSQVGELHFISGDTSQHQHLHHAGWAWKNVTFIEDFYTDSGNDSIYFTDLMDLNSGQSAIKATDRRGNGPEVLAHLPGEIPYRLCVSTSGELLFYLARQTSDNASFRLRFINLQDGSRGTLYTSAQKIDSLQLNPLEESISLKHPTQGLVSFDTDLYSIQVLAEALH